MKFIEVKVFTSNQGLEILAGAMMELGLTDFVIDDPTEIADLLKKKNAYDWDYIDESVLKMEGNEPSISIYLENNDDGINILENIKLQVKELEVKAAEGFFGSGISLGRLRVEDSIVDDEAWKDNWKEFFKPTKVTEKIIIKPTWYEYESKEGELVIEIDPGMAFGTGTHPTTSMCMKLLERYEGSTKTVLDVGCGSGILSIAAALLGAEQVLGVEIDTIAVNIAKENVKANNLCDKIKIKEGDLTKHIEEKFDVVVANLMADLVLLVSEDVHKNIAPKGVFIASGILIERQEEVLTGMRRAGFEIIDVIEEREWCAVLARVKKS